MHAEAGSDLGHGATGVELPQGLFAEVAGTRTVHPASLPQSHVIRKPL